MYILGFVLEQSGREQKLQEFNRTSSNSHDLAPESCRVAHEIVRIHSNSYRTHRTEQITNE